MAGLLVFGMPGRSLRPVILSGIETTIGSAKQCSANNSSTTRGTGRIEFDTLYEKVLGDMPTAP